MSASNHTSRTWFNSQDCPPTARHNVVTITIMHIARLLALLVVVSDYRSYLLALIRYSHTPSPRLAHITVYRRVRAAIPNLFEIPCYTLLPVYFPITPSRSNRTRKPTTKSVWQAKFETGHFGSYNEAEHLTSVPTTGITVITLG